MLKFLKSNSFTSLLKRTLATRSISPLQEASLAERCILVDENDKAIGDESKRKCHLVQQDGSLLLHRAFSVYLFNTKGEFLLHKRSNNKVSFPGRVTNSCCSHPLYEIPEERNGAMGVKIAAKRRLNIELGIPLSEISLNDFQYMTRIQYQDVGDGIWGEHELAYILLLVKDVTIKPNLEEISEVKYVAKEELESYLNLCKAPISPWFNLIRKHHLYKWWSDLKNLKKFEDHSTIHRY